MIAQTDAPRRHRFLGPLFEWTCWAATISGIVVLLVLLGQLFYQGWAWLDWHFLTSFPSRFASKAGVKPALVGSLWVIILTALFSVPTGVGCAVYLEEFAPRNSRWRKFVEMNIANLAGVPSIVYGILGLALFVRAMALDRSVMAGALTLGLVILPTIILTSQEALRAVPQTIRQAAFALGATRWQVVWHQVLPVAYPGILTGVILSLARALGEAAPLITVGGLTYVAFLPEHPLDGFTTLPIQVFNWTSRPQAEFHQLAAAGILVLLAVMLVLNGIAVVLRHRQARRVQGHRR
jgi:phosphate transport system permease protein